MSDALPASAALEMIGRLLVAALLGGVVGLDRELRAKPAGLRTNMLIAVGAALFAIVSVHMEPLAPSRVAANVAPGIGFIGAGVILRGHRGVAGITTAATIFVVAAVGLAAGAGMWRTACAATLIVVVTLLALSPLERWIRPFVARRMLRYTDEDGTDR